MQEVAAQKKYSLEKENCSYVQQKKPEFSCIFFQTQILRREAQQHILSAS